MTHILVVSGLLCAAGFQTLAQQVGGIGMGAMLTQDQRAKMREVMQGSQTELTQLNEKLATAQKEAIKAAIAPGADEKTVRAKVEAVAKIQTDISVLRLKAVKGIASTLTDEQKTQMDNRPAQAYNMLLGSYGGMGGGGRGGPGGARGGRNQ